MRVAAALLCLACARGVPEPIEPFTRTPDAPFRDRAPAVTRGAHPLRLPLVRASRLDNGLVVFVVPRYELPLVTLEVAVRGAGLEGAGPEAAALWLTALSIAESEGDGLAAEVGPSGSQIAITRESSAFEGAARALAEAVQNPHFAPEHSESARRDLLGRLASPEERLRARESLIANQLLYRDPPATVLDAMVAEAVVAKERLSVLHRAHYRPEQSALIVAGAVEPEHALEVADALFGEWHPVAPPRVPLPRVPPALAPGAGMRPIGALHAQRPHARVRVTLPGPAQESASFACFELLRARLAHTIAGAAEKSQRAGERGVATVDLRELGGGSELVLELLVEPEALADALGRVQAELEVLTEKPLSPGEVSWLKMVWQSRLAASLLSNRGTAQLLGRRFLLGEDPAALEAWVRRTAALTPEGIHDFARVWLAPERVQFVVTADQRRVEASLARLGRAVWYGL